MLYVFHGSDVRQAGEKARALVNSLRAKRTDAAFARIEANDWSDSLIEEHIGGQGLFSSKYIVFLDRITEHAEAKEKIFDFIPAMRESANIFIVLEGKVNAELKKAFEKHAEKVVVFEKQSSASSLGRITDGKEDFNIFALTNAVAAGETLKAWKIYREAVERGTPAENILGVLFWKAKSTSSSKLARDIVALYHEGHRGTVDLELGIERLLLGLNI